MAKFSMSFQVGIWNSELMLSVLRRNESPWDSELRGTERVNELYGTLRILGTDSRPVEYQPVYRIHKQQLTTNKSMRFTCTIEPLDLGMQTNQTSNYWKMKYLM